MESDIFIFLLWEIMGKFWEVSICPKFPQEKTVKLYHLLQLIGAETVSYLHLVTLGTGASKIL